MNPTVALTRTASSNQRMASVLEAEGFDTLDWPATELEPRLEVNDPLMDQICLSQLLVFVSPGVVDVLEKGWPGWTDWAKGSRIASMGPGTTLALDQAGIPVDLEASPPRASGMASVLLAELGDDIVVDVLCGDRTRPELAQSLRAAGRTVEERVIYQSIAPPVLERETRPLHAVVYGSPSGARRMLAANSWLYRIPAVALGPTTGGWLREAGFHRRVYEAETPDSRSVIAVLQQL